MIAGAPCLFLLKWSLEPPCSSLSLPGYCGRGGRLGEVVTYYGAGWRDCILDALSIGQRSHVKKNRLPSPRQLTTAPGTHSQQLCPLSRTQKQYPLSRDMLLFVDAQTPFSPDPGLSLRPPLFRNRIIMSGPRGTREFIYNNIMSASIDRLTGIRSSPTPLSPSP